MVFNCNILFTAILSKDLLHIHCNLKMYKVKARHKIKIITSQGKDKIILGPQIILTDGPSVFLACSLLYKKRMGVHKTYTRERKSLNTAITELILSQFAYI